MGSALRNMGKTRANFTGDHIADAAAAIAVQHTQGNHRSFLGDSHCAAGCCGGNMRAVAITVARVPVVCAPRKVAPVACMTRFSDAPLKTPVLMADVHLISMDSALMHDEWPLSLKFSYACFPSRGSSGCHSAQATTRLMYLLFRCMPRLCRMSCTKPSSYPSDDAWRGLAQTWRRHGRDPPIF